MTRFHVQGLLLRICDQPDGALPHTPARGSRGPCAPLRSSQARRARLPLYGAYNENKTLVTRRIAVQNSLTSELVTGEQAWLWWWIGGAAAAMVIALGVWVWLKGQPFAAGDVFRASRVSAGNRLFPTQVLITPTSVVQYTPRWIGKREQTIHMAHVASVNIDTGAVLSNVLIETSGGSDPIVCHGHRKGEAVRMKALIERYQTDYYRPEHPRPVAGSDSSR